jgi:RimJ/RimL family protein N-acetyltransferase
MLQGNNVVLTNLREADREMLFTWINDAETVRFNSPYVPVGWAAHCRWFDGLANDPTRVVLAMRRSPDGHALGTVQLQAIHPVHRSAELTVRIGSETDRGKRMGTEAIRLTVRFGFDDLNLQRIWLRVFANNARAIRAYQAAGFVTEGTMRRAAYINGRWEDEVVMAVLREQP